jgi:hypothetical protein
MRWKKKIAMPLSCNIKNGTRFSRNAFALRPCCRQWLNKKLKYTAYAPNEFCKNRPTISKT